MADQNSNSSAVLETPHGLLTVVRGIRDLNIPKDDEAMDDSEGFESDFDPDDLDDYYFGEDAKECRPVLSTSLKRMIPKIQRGLYIAQLEPKDRTVLLDDIGTRKCGEPCYDISAPGSYERLLKIEDYVHFGAEVRRFATNSAFAEPLLLDEPETAETATKAHPTPIQLMDSKIIATKVSRPSVFKTQQQTPVVRALNLTHTLPAGFEIPEDVQLPDGVKRAPAVKAISRKRVASHELERSPASTHTAAPEGPTNTAAPEPSTSKKARVDNGDPTKSSPEVQFKAATPSKSFPFIKMLPHPELGLAMVQAFTPKQLLDLYCISKEFQFLMNSHMTTYILTNARTNAPHGLKIFPWFFYRRLAFLDPAARKMPHRDEIRHVPSLKYLLMIEQRQKTVDGILREMAKKGHRCPRDTHIAVQKLWLVMNIPQSANRIALLHNEEYWTNKDLMLAVTFFMKLDMCFCDCERLNAGSIMLRKTMMSEQSMTPLFKLLRGYYTPLQIVQRYIRYDYNPSHNVRHLDVAGIPHFEVGAGATEGWGMGQERLLRPDEAVMMECMRRRISISSHTLDIMMYGYGRATDNLTFLDSSTGEADPRFFVDFEGNDVDALKWHLDNIPSDSRAEEVS